MNYEVFSRVRIFLRRNRHEHSLAILDRHRNLIHSGVVRDVEIITSIFNQVVCNCVSRSFRCELLAKVKRDVAVSIIICSSNLGTSIAIECPPSERIIRIFAVDRKGELPVFELAARQLLGRL